MKVAQERATGMWLICEILKISGIGQTSVVLEIDGKDGWKTKKAAEKVVLKVKLGKAKKIVEAGGPESKNAF